MGSERLYIVKTVAGEEFGPLDQEALVKYAENGKIAYNDKIRSTLIPQWEQAVNLKFLEPLLRAQREKAVLQQHGGFWERVKRRVTLEAVESPSENATLRASTFPKASLGQRFAAAFLDLLIVVLGCLVLLGLCYFLLRGGILGHGVVVYFLAIGCWLWALLYYAVSLSSRTQTVGQRFFGVYLMRTKKNAPLRICRCYFYAIFMLLLGIFTPLFCLIAGRSFQELLTGTKVSKLAVQQRRSN